MRIVALILGFFWFLGFGAFEISIQKKHQEPQGPFDLIAVLTGGDGRIGAGFRLLKKEPSSKLLISGVISKNYLTDVRLAQDQSLKGRVLLGTESDNTHENALEVKKTVDDLGAKRILLITSDYHIPRALLLTQRMLKNIAIETYGVTNKNRFDFESRETILSEFLEYNKFLVAFANTTLRKMIP